VYVPPGWSSLYAPLDNALHQGVGLLLLTPAIYGLVIYLGLLALLARRTANRRVTLSREKTSW